MTVVFNNIINLYFNYCSTELHHGGGTPTGKNKVDTLTKLTTEEMLYCVYAMADLILHASFTIWLILTCSQPVYGRAASNAPINCFPYPPPPPLVGI